MAGVSINTGPVDYRDRLDKSPKSKWSTIFSERRLYIGAWMPMCYRLVG